MYEAENKMRQSIPEYAQFIYNKAFSRMEVTLADHRQWEKLETLPQNWTTPRQTTSKQTTYYVKGECSPTERICQIFKNPSDKFIGLDILEPSQSFSNIKE